MSVASEGGLTSSESGDILSQALFQTGLSAPVKKEKESAVFDLPEEHLFSCDVQTLTNNLISKMEDNPVLETQLPSLKSEQEAFSVLGNQTSQVPAKGNFFPSVTIPQLVSGGGTTNSSYTGGVMMPKLKKLENGIVPPPQHQSFTPVAPQQPVNVSPVALQPTPTTPQPQQDVFGPGESSSNFGGVVDIELEDLLAIDVTDNQPSIDMYGSGMSNPPNVSVPQSGGSYSFGGPSSSSQSPYPMQTQYNSYQQPTVNQPSPSSHLPELSDDILDFLSEDSFMMDSSLSGQNAVPYPSQNHVHSQYGRPSMPPPPYGPSTMSNLVTTASLSNSSGSMTGFNIRQHQQVGGSGSGRSMLPQQLQRVTGRGGGAGFPNRTVTMAGNLIRQTPPGSSEPVGHDPVDSEDEDDDFTGADTYANYTPSKVKMGQPHPDAVVESSSLSSVEPPDVYFDLRLPQDAIQMGKLSALQLESVIYASQQHMNILPDGTRAGFLVGDGAGVGKGRIIAGIIFQNYLEGRKKAIWLSVSNDLKLDAARDLKDIGAKKIDIYSLNKFHYGKISGKRNGRVRKGVIFATYSSLIGESTMGGKYKTRFDQLVHWLGSQFEGVIVFDECHKAKNLVPTGAGKPSKTGQTVLQLQKRLPKARIVYCSATGASEPKNMAYMSRLGIWGKGTQFGGFQDFIKAVEKRGVGAMEIVAIDMKLRGMYMARQLSFGGVTFSINEVELTEKFVEVYDASVKLWAETRRLFQEAADLLEYDKPKLKTMWGQFWASHQRFFKYMCIAAKVPETIRLAKKALGEGKCVVIGLQSTGEARTLEQLERNNGELDGFISTTKGVLETLIRRHFPSQTQEMGLPGIDWNLIDNDPTLPRSCRRRRRVKDPSKRPKTWGMDTPNDSNSEESSGSPEKSDSAVESSSDEAERSSEGSGSSSSENEDEEDDINPFGNEMSDPWLQKKVKPKKRKRQWSPQTSNTASPSQKRRRNFSIKPPPHSSNKKGKTKTGFNSKKLKFENVQSPDGASNRPSPPLPTPRHTPSTPMDLPGLTQSLGERLSGSHTPSPAPSDGFGRVSQLPMPSLFGGGASAPVAERVGSNGQNLVDAMGSKFGTPTGLPMGGNSVVKNMKEELLKKLEVLSPHLPTNTLDELIDGLGGTRAVAEMTGRRGRVVSLPGGGVQYQLRSEQDVSTELLNIKEKQRFMDGDKDVAIISEAASSGISLQADRRAKNQKRRVHVTLELPWSADRAIQQFGRTHRSNQVSAPEYVFLISALSGEQRFASIVAKRLQSLGALTHGDRRATESRDLSKYNVDTKYGRQALEKTVRSVVGAEAPNVKMDDYPDNFFEECCNSMVAVGLLRPPIGGRMGLGNVDKDATTMSRFLNRILGLPVKLQNQLFSYFSDTLAAVVQKAKRTGHWDGGILDFGSSGELVQIVNTERYSGDTTYNVFASTTELHTVEVERGMSFEQALAKLNADTYPGEGFYASKRVTNDKQRIVMLKSADSAGKYFVQHRPNTGCSRSEKLSKILKTYEKVSVEEGKKWWTSHYESSLTVCSHAFWQGRCRQAASGCHHGLRRKTYYMLVGSVLGVWSHIEGVFNRCPSQNQRMQIIRIKTSSKRLVGILVPKSCIEDMRRTLSDVSHQDEDGTQGHPITCD